LYERNGIPYTKNITAEYVTENTYSLIDPKGNTMSVEKGLV
jgi:hypothetical protein